jgi:hypothetical protein
VPIWVLIRKIESARLGAAAGDDTERMLSQLADEFEEVWVQEVFARSVDDAVYQEARKRGIARAIDLELFLKEQARRIGPAARPPWHLPDDEAVVTMATPMCSSPSTFIYRNALHLSALWQFSNEGWSALHLSFFDGQHWHDDGRSRCGLILSVGPNATQNQSIEFDQLCKNRLNWFAADPATVELLEPGRQLLVCAPHRENKCLAFFAMNPPEIYFAPVVVPVAPAAPVGTALIRFAGKLRVLYADLSLSIVCGVIPEDPRVPVPVPAQAGTPLHLDARCRTDRRISATVFDKRLYCAYRETGTAGKLWCTSTDDGVNWNDPAALPGEGANDAPSLTVFDGPEGRRLYCAYAGRGGDEPLYVMSSADGVTWDSPMPVGNVRTGSAPSLVAFADQQERRLYCFYQSLAAKDGRGAPISYRVMAGA